MLTMCSSLFLRFCASARGGAGRPACLCCCWLMDSRRTKPEFWGRIETLEFPGTCWDIRKLYQEVLCGVIGKLAEGNI